MRALQPWFDKKPEPEELLLDGYFIIPGHAVILPAEL
jgi:hypothetical protein